MATAPAIPDRPPVLNRPPLLAERLRFIQPTLPPLGRVMDEYSRVYSTGLITNGKMVERFESAAAEYLQARHCVAVSSCTSGLALVMRALGVHGEVILPSFTFFATGHAALWNGLRPVFADCDSGTWTVNVEDVERRITPETTAIVAVHLYGNPCDIQALERLAMRRRLRLIFDAAHAFGSRYRGKPIGSFGDAEVFSLSPTKLLVAGEGGLVATNDATLARLIRAARNYGDLGAYDPEVLGLNARMPEFNAALGLAGMDLVEHKVRRHNRIADMYTARLADIDGLSFQHVSPEDRSTYKDYSVCIDPHRFPMTRDETAAALRRENIETKMYFYPPMHRQKLYAGYHDPATAALPVTNRVAGGILSLPVYESLSDEVVEAVTAGIRAIAQS